MATAKPVKYEKEELFDKEITPILEQLIKTGKKHGLAFLTAFQLKVEDSGRVVMAIHNNLPKGTIKELPYAERILKGEMVVLDVQDDEAEKLKLTDGIISLYEKHAEDCVECRATIELARKKGKKLTIEDFAHEPPTADKPKKARKAVPAKKVAEVLAKGKKPKEAAEELAKAEEVEIPEPEKKLSPKLKSFFANK